jgi:hypothetical protein
MYAPLARPVSELATPRFGRPDVTLLHDSAVRSEPKERRPGDRLHGPVETGHHGPPVDCGAIAPHDRLAEAALGLGLPLESPEHIIPRSLGLAERLRIEERPLGVESRDRVDVRSRPGARPYVRPPSCGGLRVYFATSIARDSRMTMTFTWPGYSSWSSISRAISCESSAAPSSSTSLGSTITRISRPACSA